MSDPYAFLVELTERELELALAGDAEGLFDLQRTRDAAMAEMPSRAPESARGLIGLAARLQLDVTRALAYAHAHDVIGTHRNALDRIARRLLEKETLTR